jgi:hypothetical protein
VASERRRGLLDLTFVLADVPDGHAFGGIGARSSKDKQLLESGACLRE